MFMNQSLLLLHRLFRRLQQKNRFIGRVQRTGLTIAETHFLLELQADPSRTIAYMAELLGLNQSSCSRIAQGMVRRGILKMTVSPVDSRRRILNITRKGEHILETVDQGAEEIIGGFSRHITTSEMHKLIEVYRMIGNGYNHPAGVRRKGESLYRVEQRRITRSFGLLGDQVFGSSFNSSQWQALSEIILSPVPPQATELSMVLGLAQNSLSSVVEVLESASLIERRQHATDKRVTVLVSKPAGRRLCQHMETQAVADLENSLSTLKNAEIAPAVDIIRRFVGEVDPVLPPLLPGYTLFPVTSAEDRAVTRGFIARQMVAYQMETFLPETWIATGNRIFQMRSAEGIEAAFELVPQGQGWQIPVAGWGAAVPPFTLLGGLHHALFDCQQEQRRASGAVQITFEPLREYLGMKQIG